MSAPRIPRLTPAQIARRLIETKDDIVKDLERGIVPHTITSVDHLRQFVNTTKYKGLRNLQQDDSAQLERLLNDWLRLRTKG